MHGIRTPGEGDEGWEAQTISLGHGPWQPPYKVIYNNGHRQNVDFYVLRSVQSLRLRPTLVRPLGTDV